MLSVIGLVVCLLSWFISYWPTWWQVSNRYSIGLTAGCVVARTSNRIAATGTPYFPPSGSPLGLELTLVLRDWFNIHIHPHRGWVTVWMPQIKVDYYRMPGGRISSRSIYLPLWMPLVLFNFLPAVRLFRHRTRTRRTVAGLCPECGYDLRGTPVRCSECGCEADIGTLTQRTLSSQDKQDDPDSSQEKRRGIVSDDFREAGIEPQIPISNTIADVKGEQNES